MTRQWNIRLVLTALTAIIAVHANANVITFDQTIFNTNFVTSSVGMRDVGAGNIVVSGVSGTVTSSLLYWHGPTNSTDPNVNATVNVAGTAVTGTNIGFSSDNFWSSTNSQAYRANVTPEITGNGTYALSNFQKPQAQINGAGMFTFYNSGLSTGKRDVVLYSGNDSNFASSYDSAGWNLTLSGINYVSGSAFLTLYVSDGQNFGTNDDGTLRVNGQVLASGGLFQGLSPRAPGAGVTNGDLTDIVSYNITTFLSPGVNSLNITLDAGFSDALSLVAAAIDLPAGAAPQSTPEPSAFLLAGAGLVAVYRLRQRQS